MAFGALALAFGMQIIIATFLPSAPGEPSSLVISTVRILIGITGMCIGLFWMLTSTGDSLRGIKGIREEAPARRRAVLSRPRPLPAGS